MKVHSRHSVAMTAAISETLNSHLMRSDGQEDLCLAIYKPSRGHSRLTAVLCEVVLPGPGDRHVHGIVTFTGKYVLRVAQVAAKCGGGVAIIHSHPAGRGWQPMSGPDRDAEGAYAILVQEMTQLPLVGMTFAVLSQTWSARVWSDYPKNGPQHRDVESVRVLGDRLKIDWNNALRPVPTRVPMLDRTVSSWGDNTQAAIARLHVLIIGLGTIGLDVAIRLAMTGLERIGGMDFDGIELVNLDRLSQATALDAWLHRSKLEVAKRATIGCATTAAFRFESYEASICEDWSVQTALDYDLIFCCVDDHPWPRSVLNALAYSDLIPVIDGGVHIDAFADGDGLRNATWRSHVLRPGRPCMACNGQLDVGGIYADKDGLFDDADYISGMPASSRPSNQNVGVFACGATAGLLAQFVSLVAAPAGIGDPGPLRFSLSTHRLEHLNLDVRPHCQVEQNAMQGDDRVAITGVDERARSVIRRRKHAQKTLRIRFARAADDAINRFRQMITKLVTPRLAEKTG